MKVQNSEHWYSSFDGEKLWYCFWKNSDQPTHFFILLHGLTGDAEAYTEVTHSLLAQLPDSAVVAVDLRGHGHSSYSFPPAHNLYQLYAQDLDCLITQLPFKRPILVGQSMAGSIIQEYVVQYGWSKVGGVVLISSSLQLPRLLFTAEKWYQLLAANLANIQFSKRRRQLNDHLMFKNSFDYSVKRIATDVHFSHLKKYLWLWLAVFGWKNEKISLFNTKKVALVAGKYDLVIPAFTQRKNHLKIPAAQYFELPSNHNAIVNVPELVSKMLVEFTRQLS